MPVLNQVLIGNSINCPLNFRSKKIEVYIINQFFIKLHHLVWSCGILLVCLLSLWGLFLFRYICVMVKIEDVVWD